jgi:hypothetical protein
LTVSPRTSPPTVGPWPTRIDATTPVGTSKRSLPNFVERHLSALVDLGKDQDLRMRNVLDGPVLSGKRGVNDLIDRPAMDEALNRHRDDLGRWNRLLDRITADRTQLLCAGHYHRSAWYYDAQVPAQLGQAFTAEYACLKDLCRSDAAAEQLLGYLEEHPELTRALFYTLPLRLQSEQVGQYSTLFNAGMAMFNNLAEWLAKLRKIEQPQPALDDLPDPPAPSPRRCSTPTARR